MIGRATIRIQLSEVAEGTDSMSGPMAVIIAGGGFEANFGPWRPNWHENRTRCWSVKEWIGSER